MPDQKNTTKNFMKTIHGTILDYHMIQNKDAVLVAVSGGPDSVALLLSLLELTEQFSIKTGIIHLNHMLRGKEATRDETFVKNLADRFSLPFYKKQEDVTAYAKKHGLSFEEAGRKVRYCFFEAIAKEHAYTKIATGHNKDDNAEQVLMNLLRGSGPRGLSGIPPVRDSRYIRPLIRVSKDRILDFLGKRSQNYVFDSSNKDMAYLRNKIRHRLMPHLQSEYNPEIMESLDRLSRILRQEEDFWEIETRMQFDNCLVQKDAFSLAFSRTKLSNLHPAILSRLFRKAIQTVKNNLKRICLAHINDIVNFCINNSQGRSLDLPDQIRIYKTRDLIMIKKEDKPLREIGKKEKQLRQMALENQDKKT